MSSKSSLKTGNNTEPRYFGTDFSTALIAIAITLVSVFALWMLAGMGESQVTGGCGAGISPKAIPLSVFLNVLNIFLLTFLIAQYLAIYGRIKTEFTLGLIILAFVLLARGILSNAILFPDVALCESMDAPYSILRGTLTTAGALVLLYLNSK